MKRTGWLIPILVFILSISILFFYQKEQNTFSLANTIEVPSILWTLVPTDVHKVVYSYAGNQIEAVRQDNIWVLPNLNNQHADDLYIYTIIENFAEPIFNEVIEIAPQDLSKYGIDETSMTFSLHDKENTEYSLIKGDSVNKTTDYVYAPLSNTVYTMDSSAFVSLKIDEVDWRNKQLLDFNLSDVAQISFSYKSVNAVLTPIASESETDEITFTSSNINDALAAEFVHFLQSSKIQQFITDNASEHVLSVYGFNNPSLKCTISLKSGSKLSLVIGNISKEENICYATINGSNNIVAIPYFDLSQFSALYAQLHGETEDYLG